MALAPPGAEPDPRDFVPPLKRKRVLPEWVAYEATKILEQNMLGGTGTAAQMGCDAAGKTGTTDNFNDAWFVGYTPHLSTAVWVGYPDAQVSMEATRIGSVAGGTWPAMIWHDFMTTAKGDKCDDFPPPTEPAPPTPPAPEPTTSRLYADDSPLNQRIPANAAVDAVSLTA